MPSGEELLLAAHAALAPVAYQFVFLGGAVVPLYLTPAGRSKARATVDADCTVKVVGFTGQVALEEALRQARLSPDMEGHIGRWIARDTAVGRLQIDVEPCGGDQLRPFYEGGLANAVVHELRQTQIPTFSLPFLFATKIVAFKNRGAGAPYASTDLEDIVQLLQHSVTSLVEEVQQCPEVAGYVAEWAKTFATDDRFNDLMAGHGGTQRAVGRLRDLAKLYE